MIDEQRITDFQNTAQQVGREYNDQQRARLKVALEYGRLLQQLHKVARQNIGQGWADRITSSVMCNTKGTMTQ